MFARSRLTRKHLKVLIVLAVFLLILAIFLGSNLILRRVNYTVTLPRLPEAFDGMVIVHLSDLHMQRLSCDRLIRHIEQAGPDIIVFTGDLWSRPLQLNDRRTDAIGVFFDRLTAIAPTYFVTGNHDIAIRQFMPRVTPVLRQAGVVLLRNDYLPIARQTADGQTQAIYLAGIDDPLEWHRRDMIEYLRARIDDMADNEPFTLLLTHRYTRLRQYAENGFDLVLAGHSHGGSVRLPWIGPIFGTTRTFFPQHAEGISHMDDTVMVTSRGLASWFPPRFLTTAEVVVITLRSG